MSVLAHKSINNSSTGYRSLLILLTDLKYIVQWEDDMGDEKKKETYEEKKDEFGNVTEKKTIEEKEEDDD